MSLEQNQRSRSTRPAGGALSRSKQPNALPITPIGYVLFDERLSDLGDRSEQGGRARPFFRSFKENSRSYLTKRIGKMGRSPTGAVDQPQVRQPLSREVPSLSIISWFVRRNFRSSSSSSAELVSMRMISAKVSAGWSQWGISLCGLFGIEIAQGPPELFRELYRFREQCRFIELYRFRDLHLPLGFAQAGAL